MLADIPALYWGDDGYSKHKHYSIHQDEDHSLQGSIDLYFDVSKTTIRLPFDKIRIREKNAEQRDTYLDFTIIRPETAGPIKYTLIKIPNNR